MDSSAFISESIGGGAITAYDQSGSPVNMQLRWGKVDSATLGAGHTDTWNLFYQTNSNATGTQVAWQNAGVNYSFDPNGQMNPLIANTTLNNVTIDGVVARHHPDRARLRRSDAVRRYQRHRAGQPGAAGRLPGRFAADRSRSATRAALSAPIRTAARSIWRK